MSDISFIPLEPSHINIICNNLWERGKQEALMFGCSLEDVYEFVKMRLGDPYAFAAVGDGQVIAIFGAFRVSSGFYRTWFLSCEDFTKYFMPITRKLKRIMDYGLSVEQCAGIETYSACIHSLAEKWFNVLGLVRDNNYTDDNGLSRFVKLRQN